MLAVIDYDAGNLKSVTNALEALQVSYCLTNNPKDLSDASGIILPGVGAFGEGMENLQKRNFIPVLDQEVMKKKKPYLGICLGLQFLAERGFEHGEHEGLGWIKGEVRLLKTNHPSIKVPHMGWNNINIQKASPLFEGLAEEPVFYFVHSYALFPEEDITIATCDHGGEITAAIQKDNIYAVQFHPEKSQTAGLIVLRNFLRLCSQNVLC